MFDCIESEDELMELKQLLSNYLTNKLVKEIERESAEKGYTNNALNAWKDEHYRSGYKDSQI